MNIVFTLIRRTYIIVAVTVGFILLFGEEQDSSAGAFLVHFFIDKALAALLLASALILADKNKRNSLKNILKFLFDIK